MKVQKRNIRGYEQLYIALPAAICKAMDIKPGMEITVSVASRDSLLLKIQRQKIAPLGDKKICR